MRPFYGETLANGLMLGTAQYPSPKVLSDAFARSGAAVATVSLRRESGRDRAGQDFWELIRALDVHVLPNTAGCHSVKEAVTTAHMAREVFDTRWIKLEVIGEEDTLQPDVFGLVEAARILSEDGFQVFPYTTEDLVVADRLLRAGCEVLMPWGAPIGSGMGLNNLFGLRAMRAHFPDVPLVIDADGLNVLIELDADARDNWILTPHPGEAGRLLGSDGATVQADRFAALESLAARYGGTVLLKGLGTLVRGDGGTALISDGNPGMATGGMGDVLTGVIAALHAQGLPGYQAAALGAMAHARAADRAAAADGERGLLATDLLAALRPVLNGDDER